MLIGYCITGSFCTLDKSIDVLKQLVEKGHEIIPIVSYNVASKDTRFYLAKDFIAEIEKICNKKVVDDIVTAEPLGPKIKCDVMCIVPCTSNTLAKIKYGITDTPVTMAVKAHVRNNRPVVIALCTNDGLGATAVNLGTMLTRKNYYFAPLFQDDYNAKPRSLISDMSAVIDTIDLAVKHIQYQPMIIEKPII